MRPLLALLLLLPLVGSPVSVQAQDDLSPFGRLLDAGLPEERLPGILEFVGQRGTPGDLGLVLRKVVDPDGFPKSVRPAALAALETAATDRHLVPTGDLDGLGTLIAANDLAPDDRRTAIRLAGVWKVESVRPALVEIALAEATPADLRTAAIRGLAGIGGTAGREALATLTADDRPLAVRYLAAAALVDFDVPAAARTAAGVLADGDGQTDPAPVLSAFFDRPGATDALATELAAVELPLDVAKMSLRYVYSVGRNDPQLTGVLSEIAGITTEPIKLSPEEMAVFLEEVRTQGDPVRGEAVFRRQDLSCFKCHALRGAGGTVGPDLATVAASSPVDYLARAILDPDKDVKEMYRTATVVTDEGKAYHGIIVDDNDTKLVLREATGQLRTFPVDTLEDREEGGSLMPKGLAGFMTRPELVDVVRFLSELGRPGDYAPTTEPTFQRWRFLHNPPPAVVADIPNDETFSAAVHEATLPWTPIYARFHGDLPLAEVAVATEGPVLLLRTELELTTAGEVTFGFDDVDGLQVWVDGESFEPDTNGRYNVDLEEGVHAIDVRLDTRVRASKTLRGLLLSSPTTTAAVKPVGGA